MSILRFDPFRDSFSEVDRLTQQLLSGTRTPASLPMDVWRSGDTYCVALDLPGMNEESLDVTLERGALTVHAERQRAFGEDDTVLVAERPQGAFTRRLMLGDELDSERIEADYRNGVLLLRIPVAQAAQPRKVQIRRTSEQASLGEGPDDARTVSSESMQMKQHDRDLVGASS